MNGKVPDNIDLLLRDFNSQAQDSRELMQNILSVISSGRAPQTEYVRELDHSLDLLREQYDAICSAAQQQLTAEEIPAADSPANAYAEAVHNSISARCREKIAAIRSMLEEFASVQSLVARYADALLPFQQQAKQFIEQLQEEDSDALDTVEQEIEGPQIFLKALACGEEDTDEKLDLIDQSAEFYPNWVQRGLAANKYFLPEGVQISSDSSLTEIPKTDISDENTAPVPEHEEPQDAPSAFVQAVEKSEILLESPNEIGALSVEKSPSEEKKISVSIFQNDLKKIGLAACKSVLTALLCHEGSIATDCVVSATEMPLKNVEITLNALQRKGYLSHYIVTPGGSLWCASDRLMKALTFQDAAKLIGIRKRPLDSWGQSVEDTISHAEMRLVCSRLMRDSVARITDAKHSTYVDSGARLLESGYSFLVSTNQKRISELFVAVFWSNTGECDEFLLGIKKILQDASDETVNRVIVAALDTGRAAALVSLLRQELSEYLKNAAVYLYSAAENAYFIELETCISSPEEYENQQKLSDEEQSTNKSANPAEQSAEEAAPAASTATETPPAAVSEEEPVAAEESMTEEAAPEKNMPAVQPSPEKLASVSSAVNPAPSVFPAEQAEVFRSNLRDLICSEQFYAAAVYARLQAQRAPENALLYAQLAYALNDPLAHCSYSTDNAFRLIEQRGTFEDALVLSAALRTFFSNQIPYDYQIKSFHDGICKYDILNEYPLLGKVLYTLMDFKSQQQKGLDAYADYHSKTKMEMEKQMQRLQHEVQDFYANFIEGHKTERASQKRFLKTKEMIFAVNNEIGQIMKAIIDGATGLQSYAVDFLQRNFYKENDVPAVDTIDNDKLWSYITDYWEEAGKTLMYSKRVDLKSHLRSNIVSSTTKAVQLIARWCSLVDQMNNSHEDAGTDAYRKIRSPLLRDIDTTVSRLEDVCRTGAPAPDTEAGLRVLAFTLSELRGCIDGSGDEENRKYFYAPFLLSDNIMLDEDFLPDLDMHSSMLHSLDPMCRVLAHGQQTHAADIAAFRARLHHLLENQIDNYGTARLLVQYLASQGDTENMEKYLEDISGSESYAHENAALSKKYFIGELELAQSYGQIDNSVEDKKEKILQIIDEWYEWAEETTNYEFFKRIMDGYLSEIKEEAKSRETDLLAQLEEFRAAVTPTLSVDTKKARIKRIQEMIRDQNYTVAEDLLARKDAIEDDFGERHEEDFLREFLNNFDTYYKPVSLTRNSLANLIHSPHNKEMRGAKQLADNWLPGGSRMGEMRLTRLLTDLGFYVESVTPQLDSGRPQKEQLEQYAVLTKKTVDGRRVRSTHPIAAFGSGAAEEGFRVVCLNGIYDSTALIDVMKQCGNAKHTLILLDCALTLPEHRRLARKTKNALVGDKMFGVIDRTVMMFLIRHYDVTKINRMLMALITPFSYYQPYVWESSNVMPAEIFMGRRHELERIEAAAGVNIVYGGRQLGKSALLKKAKIDINKNEKGDRAVLVDIKGLNFRQAAKKIAFALHDEGILKDELNTEDWDILARAVKRRLMDGKDRIPYLLLLLDEADVFIESCGEVKYQPFDALKDIQSIGVGRFKFVIAGLRNIVRFKRETALSNNSVLTQLDAMTVKPFTTSEARELLEVPLHYLGLEFPKEKESLIALILATTNYFPGLIQMYCAKLIGAMRSSDYANYSDTDTPIYEVSEEHIKKVLADAEFTQQIREKYMITLRLDEDNYYYLIALLMAWLYHINGYRSGYSAADIKKAGTDLEISKISSLEDSKLEALMEELRELNVLRSTDEHHYLFTRLTFFQMMGTQSTVDDELEKYMGQ